MLIFSLDSSDEDRIECIHKEVRLGIRIYILNKTALAFSQSLCQEIKIFVKLSSTFSTQKYLSPGPVPYVLNVTTREGSGTLNFLGRWALIPVKETLALFCFHQLKQQTQMPNNSSLSKIFQCHVQFRLSFGLFHRLEYLLNFSCMFKKYCPVESNVNMYNKFQSL